MKFYSQSSFVYSDDGYRCAGWEDEDIIVHANSEKQARQKIWNWARRKPRYAVQRNIHFCDKQQFWGDKIYPLKLIK